MKKTLDVAFEVKALQAREFEGLGSTFGNIDLGGDIVMPGAFGRSLAEHRKADTMPLMFWMHDPAQIPGVWLDIAENDDGLSVRGELVDTSLGNDMRTLLQKKAVRGLSIGFETVEADFDRDGNRRLKEIKLWEVSLVSLAMNPLARIEAVKARLSADGEYVPTERQVEEWLRRDLHCSKKISRALVARVFDKDAGGTPVAPRRDAGDVESEAKELIAAAEGFTDKLFAASIRR